MLQITIPEREFFDSEKQEFVYLKEQKLVLEHSLISISKWESKWKKPFLNKEQKTVEESRDYVRCMTLNKDVDPTVYTTLSNDVFAKINAYIEDGMTATWFNEQNAKNMLGRNSGTAITSEIIYNWMVSFQIPFEPCEKWHLNRLLTLIKVCELKNAPKKKMKRKDIYARNAALNAARKKQFGTNG